MESSEFVKTIGDKHATEKVEIIIDPITGLPALTAGKAAPILTSEEVAEMLADFP